MKTTIQYLTGDATMPSSPGNKIIAHICNDRGGWGKGFVLAISKRWPQPEAAYREWYCNRATNDFALGAMQLVKVESHLSVANLIGQHGMTKGKGGPPIRYDAVKTGLQKIVQPAPYQRASVHMPRIGCGLAGGKWELIEPLINGSLCNAGIEVFVYDLE
jgi:O-acetyl-ADP-ribose deacetylase (regulator of RNase III)